MLFTLLNWVVQIIGLTDSFFCGERLGGDDDFFVKNILFFPMGKSLVVDIS